MGNDYCDSIQWNVIDTESPDKVKDANNVLLVRLGCQKSLEEPIIIMDPFNFPQLIIQSCDAFAHDRCFMRAIVDPQNRDRAGSSSVDDAFVIFHWDKEAFISKH